MRKIYDFTNAFKNPYTGDKMKRPKGLKCGNLKGPTRIDKLEKDVAKLKAAIKKLQHA